MFNFLTLFASDMERTADVYRAIGLSFINEKHGEGPIHLAHEKDGFVLEIYQKSQAICDGMMLGFEASDISETRAKILQTGANLVKDIAKIDGVDRMIVADPEGRQIYIQQA